jgi:hypothetical protein
MYLYLMQALIFCAVVGSNIQGIVSCGRSIRRFARLAHFAPSAPRDHFTHAIARQETEKEEQNDIGHIPLQNPKII